IVLLDGGHGITRSKGRILPCKRHANVSDQKCTRRHITVQQNQSPRLDDKSEEHYTAPNNRRFRGHLPPIAATLNKVLKRDAPGGSSVRAILFSVSPGVADEPVRARRTANRTEEGDGGDARVIQGSWSAR